jgi:hypothetical protein
MTNLGLIKSDKVISLKATYKTHSRIYIITEACNGGDLSLLKEAKGGFIPEAECKIIISKII